MISICTPYYPWYRDHDRSREIFDTLIPSMNKANYQEMELVVLDCGIRDIWGNKRARDVFSFYEDLSKAYKGKLVYSLTDQGVTPADHKYPFRFWMANAVNLAIKAGSYEDSFIMNMDMEIPEDFVEKYHENVKDGQVWFPKCYHIRRDMQRIHENGGWRSGRGLVGIKQKDYWAIGGTDHTNYIKDRHDSDLYTRVIAKYPYVEEPLIGFFHVDHPGTNENTSEFKGTWNKA